MTDSVEAGGWGDDLTVHIQIVGMGDSLGVSLVIQQEELKGLNDNWEEVLDTNATLDRE